MEEIIEIDLKDKYDLIDKYNEKKLSKEFLEYIINKADLTRVNKKIKVIINKKCDINVDVTKLIKEGLKEEYKRNLQERDDNNVKQFMFLLLGIIFIFLSTRIEDGIIWKEILLISGWVPIWEMIEVELLSDADNRKKRKIIKRILKGEFIEKNIKNEEIYK